MTEGQKRAYIVAGVAVLIALLIWRHRVTNVNVDKRTQTPGDVTVTPTLNLYDVAPLRPVGTDFDWMQTTDLGCDCDEVFNPAPWEAPEPVLVAYPVYHYASNTEYVPSAPINATFVSYVPPPPPEWWYEEGYNVHHEKALFIYTATGVNGILGKYSRSAWSDPEKRNAYPQQSKNVVRQADGTCIIDGVTFMHNAKRDAYMPVVPAIASGGMAMTWH